MQPGSYYKTETLLAAMEEYGIVKALALHSLAKEYHVADGNAALMREIADRPALEGKWAVMPHHTEEFPKPDALRKELKAHRIRAVAMFGGDHAFLIEPWCCGELYAMLEESRIPLFLESGQTSWGTLNTILTAYPTIRIVLTHLHYSCARFLYPLLEKHENLYVETFGFKTFNGIEDVCRRFGAKRLIFGSGAPVYATTAAIGMVMYAAISPEEKHLIARGNLEHLLSSVVF
jgi:predicted TIM-barrel fold metal-dependent hydrolase